MIEVRHPICDQCNTYHPQLPVGKKCPMAPEVTKDGQKLDFNKIFGPLKTILTAQVDIKGIKNFDLFIIYMIVEITKAAEAYKETIALKEK